MDYSYDYGYGGYDSMPIDSFDSSFNASVGPALAVVGIISLAVFVVTLIAMIKLYKKFNRPGWAPIVPIYNMWVLFEMGNLPGWLSLIPGVNGICTLVAYFQIAKKLGKSTGFAVCTIFFMPICVLIMSFDSSMPVNQNMNNNYQGMNNNYQGMNNNYQGMNNQQMNNVQNMVNNQQPMTQQPMNQQPMNQQPLNQQPMPQGQTTVSETQVNEIPTSTFVPTEPVTPQPMPQENVPTVDAPQFTNINDNNNQ